MPVSIFNGFRNKWLFLGLMAAWFIINLLQAIFTEINADEAYYFLWGKNPDWGYFDHPPFVGWLTYLSSIFFNGNLGVRFMTVILFTGTLLLTWMQLRKPTDRQSIVAFFIIAASMGMFNVYGFITTPDVPLLFFIALFFFSYKKFIQDPHWTSIILLTISMTGVVYSKYHGLLVIGFVILSNLRLLANWKFWLAGIMMLILSIPHFQWLYLHDFPSFRYHFAAFEFKPVQLFEFIPTQLAAFNPVTLGLLVFLLIRYRPAGKIEWAQYFSVIGVIFFFWLMAYRGHIQAHWTVAASIPAITLIHDHAIRSEKILRHVKKFIGPTLVILLLMRILLVTDLLPREWGLSGKKKDYLRLGSIAGNNPVIFTRAFQQASLYQFFTGKPAGMISSLAIRKSQFDIWKWEQDWANDSVLVLVQENRSPIFDLDGGIKRILLADHFQSPNQLKISFKTSQAQYQTGDSLFLDFKLVNSGSNLFNFNDPIYPARLIPVFRDRSGFVYRYDGKLNDSLGLIKPGQEIFSRINFSIPSIPPGKYELGLSCNTEFGPANNSNFIPIRIGN